MAPSSLHYSRQHISKPSVIYLGTQLQKSSELIERPSRLFFLHPFIFLLCYCAIILLSDCVIKRLCNSTIVRFVRLCDLAILRQCDCLTVRFARLCDCAIVRSCNCPISHLCNLCNSAILRLVRLRDHAIMRLCDLRLRDHAIMRLCDLRLCDLAIV